MWKFYEVSLEIQDRIVGGIPRREKLIEAWLEARAPAKAPEGAMPLADLSAQVAEEVEASPDLMAVGFKRENGVAYIEGRQIKAMLKEAANILKGPPFLDIRNARSKLAERIFVEPRVIPVGNVEDVKEAQRVVHVMTAQGPRSGLKLYEYLEGPTLSFRLRVLDDGLFDLPTLTTLFEYAAENGLGADRSQDEGKFKVVTLREVV